MQIAQTVALKSADLSRQVGAVILDDRGGLISAGCNEVPQPMIGTYAKPEDYIDNFPRLSKPDYSHAYITLEDAWFMNTKILLN